MFKLFPRKFSVFFRNRLAIRSLLVLRHKECSLHFLYFAEELKDHLDEYIRRFNGLVRVIRKNIRHGLIRAKLAGAREATGEVVVFLDSHCEANAGW